MKKWILVIAIVAFALLMAIRPEFHSSWSRCIIAAFAGGILGFGIVSSRGRKV